MSVPVISQLKKILIIRWGALGDLALCSAVFEDLSHYLPDAEIHLNVDPAWSALFADDKRFSRIITQKMRGGSFFNSVRQWLKLLKKERYDLVIDLQSNDRSRIYLSIAHWMGVAPAYRLSTRLVYPYNVPVESLAGNAHALTVFQLPLKALGLNPQTNAPCIYSPQQSEAAVNKLLHEKDVPAHDFIIFVPGSSLSGIAKRWGEKNYIVLGKKMIAQRKVKNIVIMGGAAELTLCQSIADGIGDPAICMAGETPLSSIVPLVKLSAGMVANDTGLAHLAAAAQVPVVVICGPTLAERVKPAGERVIALQAPVECFKNSSAVDCMSAISPDQVLDALY